MHLDDFYVAMVQGIHRQLFLERVHIPFEGLRAHLMFAISVSVGAGIAGKSTKSLTHTLDIWPN